MFDDFQAAPLTDLDDLDLPDPESEEDASEDPTAFASTADILAAVAARVAATQSIGELELDEESSEAAEPTLAHQPVLAPQVPAAQPAATATPVVPAPVAPVAAAAVATAPQAQPAAAPGGGIGAILLAMLMISAAIGIAAWLAVSGGL